MMRDVIMTRQRLTTILTTLLILLVMAMPVAAQEETAVGWNPPNWLGWFLSILAIVLMVATSYWVRNRSM